MIVADDVTFLTENTLGIDSVAELEQMKEDTAYLDQRRVERAQQREDRADAARRRFRELQPLRDVTLADIERRAMPTVAEAARSILDHGGRLKVRNGNLHVSLPERLSEAEAEDNEIRGRLLDASLVLYSAANVVVPALESRSKKPLDERLPDAQVLAGGGLE